MRRAALRLFLLFLPTTFGLASCTSANETQAENTKPGTAAWQLTNPAQKREIEGYASLTSVNIGGTISFFVSTSDSAYSMDFYRIGWYGGTGGREVLGPISRQGGLQPTPAADSFGTFECNWTNPYVLSVPTNWTSGVYLVKLTGSSGGKQSYIQFVVREDSRNSVYLFQRSITTDQAYNNWPGSGVGKSLYGFNSSNGVAAVKVSFDRPYSIDDSLWSTHVGAGYFPRWEINMIRWLEMNGYDVTYVTNIDVHEDPNLLLTHKAFLSVGHDEYWSWQMRENVELASDAGIGLGFFAGNESYWQIRLEPSPITGATDRIQVAYKSLSDPITDVCLVTFYWRENSCKPSEQAFIGVESSAYNVGANMVIADATNWALAGTGLVNGSILPGVLGYEVDGLVEPDSPPGTALIAHSPLPSTAISEETPAYPYSDMVAYTAASGATVFAVGTIQWSWALDDWGAPTQRSSMLNTAAQQITQNVLARLVTLVSPNTAGPVTDDFTGSSLNNSLWTFVNPLNDASISLTGSEVAINVPGGSTHDPWASAGDTAPRLMQPISNVNYFEVVAKFDSPVVSNNQNEGIQVQQDGTNLLRFEVYYAGGGTRLFSGSLLNGTAVTWLDTQVTITFPIWLQLKRSGTTWVYSWSKDGKTYTTALVQTQALTTNNIGVFAANCCSTSAPAFTSRIDYFINTSDAYEVSPIVPGPVTVTQTLAIVSWATLLPMTSEVDYGTSSAYSYQTPLDPTLVTSHSQTLLGLTCGIEYHYQMTSAEIGTDETPSSVAKSADATFVTASCTEAPAVPGNLVATGGNAQVALSWSGSTGATSYNVKRSTTNGGPYTTVASPTGTSDTDTGLTNGTTYYYAVTAVNSAGESGNSNQASATPAIVVISKTNVTSGADVSGNRVSKIPAAAANHTAGNLLVVACKHGTDLTTTMSVSDTAGNTYTALPMTAQSSIGAMQLFYAKNVLGNANNVVSCSFSASVAYVAVDVVQYAGLDTISPLDTHAENFSNAASNTCTSGGFTTATANEVVVGACTPSATGKSYTAGSGYTLEVTDAGGQVGVEDQVVSSVQTNATTTESFNGSGGTWIMLVATFRE